MNASVQLITAPWSGYSWSPGASATGIMGGGAATPVVPGSGFSWATIVGSKVGGPVSAYLPNTRGVPMTTSYVRRYRGGLRGLGQTDAVDMTGGPVAGPMMICPDGTQVYSSSQCPGGVPAAGSTSDLATALAKIFTPLSQAGGAALQQYVSYGNPLYQKQTVALTPQGQVVYATNQPTGGAGPGLATGALAGGGLTMLLIGGLVVFLMSRK